VALLKAKRGIIMEEAAKVDKGITSPNGTPTVPSQMAPVVVEPYSERVAIPQSPLSSSRRIMLPAYSRDVGEAFSQPQPTPGEKRGLLAAPSDGTLQSPAGEKRERLESPSGGVLRALTGEKRGLLSSSSTGELLLPKEAVSVEELSTAPLQTVSPYAPAVVEVEHVPTNSGAVAPEEASKALPSCSLEAATVAEVGNGFINPGDAHETSGDGPVDCFVESFTVPVGTDSEMYSQDECRVGWPLSTISDCSSLRTS